VNRPVERVPSIPGSRYAAELNKGAASMRFPRELEHEFLRFYLVERRGHLRSFNSIMGALFVLACAESVWAAPFRTQLAQHLRLGTIAVAFLAMAWVAYSRHHERFYLDTAHYASLVISLVGAVEVAYRIHAGEGEFFALLTPYSIGLYFFAGILYPAMLQANLLMIVALAATLIFLGEPAAKIAGLTAMLTATAVIGGLALHTQAVRFRRAFLEHRLIAEMAARDGLTGLKNRRAFDEHLTRTWQQALRDRRQLALMMIDVDHFKKFNDRYGHQAGDEALQRIAAVVDSFARRPLDFASRYGGEELALVLFDVSREHAERVAELLRASVQNLQIPHSDHAAGVATISLGVAIVHPTLERSPEGAVQLADEALYAAKREGRNRVRIFESEYQGLSTGIFRPQ
jgi:diguanylate cyclase (GGDEF)-like protein